GNLHKGALPREQLARIKEVLKARFKQEVYEEKGYLRVREFTSRFGNLGFNLPDGQIIFTTSPSQVKVSYRKRKPGGDLAYFNKELAKGEIIFEVKEKDEVEKKEGNRTKRKDKRRLAKLGLAISEEVSHDQPLKVSQSLAEVSHNVPEVSHLKPVSHEEVSHSPGEVSQTGKVSQLNSEQVSHEEVNHNSSEQVSHDEVSQISPEK
ncbi:11211_t:CDS:2, partial [Funneliformis geosporum]